MQLPHSRPAARTNDDLMRFSLQPPRWFLPVFGVLAVTFGAGVVGIGLIVVFGLGLLGYTHVQLWATLITHFVFWVGISHSGVMISAVLRLTHAEWRRPITRAGEILALFALLTAALFPILHTGRPWRALYWLFPYDFARDIWPNVRSPLVWDVTAILTYLTGTLLFIYVDLIPDLAIMRDRVTTGWRHRLYDVLALGFRGSTRQWRLQRKAGILLSALIVPVFISVHSTVAWDFGMALVPGWHSTIFAPYFVIGAIHSGMAAVAMTMAVLRWGFRLHTYVTRDHFEMLGRLQLVVALGYAYFFLMDFMFGLFAREPLEVRIWEQRLFDPPTNVLFGVQVLATILVPLPLLAMKRVRRSVAAMFWIGLLVNVGMWLERYILVVTPLSLKQPFVFTWVDTYVPRPIEYVFTLAFVALVALGMLLFARLFPIVPIWDVKEGEVLARRVQVGRSTVPGVVRE